jgi:hypothetical protein
MEDRARRTTTWVRLQLNHDYGALVSWCDVDSRTSGWNFAGDVSFSLSLGYSENLEDSEWTPVPLHAAQKSGRVHAGRASSHCVDSVCAAD